MALGARLARFDPCRVRTLARSETAGPPAKRRQSLANSAPCPLSYVAVGAGPEPAFIDVDADFRTAMTVGKKI